MASRTKTWSISADWIVPVDKPPIRGGILRGRGGLIEAVGTPHTVSYATSHRDLGSVAILPGLINAHTHLELSHLRGKLPPRRPMTQWLFALLRKRVTGHGLAKSVALGAEEALATGTTTLADVCHNNHAWQTLKDYPFRKLCLAEVTGIGATATNAMDRLQKHLTGIRRTDKLRFGISPHSPYSTSEEVYRASIELARKRDMLVATHLAETEAERQFLLHGTGRFFEFLARLGLIDSTVPVYGCTPLVFAQRVGLFDRPCILAHVNYIDDEEFQILAASGASVVYCPRSSMFFGRSGHRYPDMIQAGINVCVGTDSLASNTSLDMFEEMRRLRGDGHVDSFTILRMATLNGAKALGWDDKIGSLTPGKQADFVVVRIPPDVINPVEAILTRKSGIIETVIAGKTVASAE